MTEPTAVVVSAAIAAFISLVGFFLTRRSAREEMDRRQREIDTDFEIKKRQLEVSLREHRVTLESARQEQLNEAFKKRAETYPALYAIISDYGRSWTLRGKSRDLQWVEQFLEALLENNARNGVFFSREVYVEYGKLRDYLTELRDRLRRNESEDVEEIERRIYEIIMGKNGGPGLGTWLKDDLGSYVTPIVSNMHPQIGPAPFRTP